MTDLPIMFRAPMVRALLREIEAPGTGKTMTRRVAWLPSKRTIGVFTDPKGREAKSSPWQKVKPGDRLFVREMWRTVQGVDDTAARYLPPHLFPVHYEADGTATDRLDKMAAMTGKGRPAPTCPRWASRITSVVSAVKIERLRNISEEDAWAEGVTDFAESVDRMAWGDLSAEHRRGVTAASYGSATSAFEHLWTTVNGSGSWDANPEVVAISFRPLLCNIDAMKA